MAVAPGAVKVDEVWEDFRLYADNPTGLRDRLVGRRKRVAHEFWALQGVSFELEPGDTMALIGANGSGKSTLLKCLAGILEPSRGSVEVGGRLAAMLELGAGFHPELSGRENVFLNASILGFGRKNVERVFDDIVAFAELEDFIDAPVRTYSSGMYLRLGFSVSIHLDPDVLLIDEVLAVGDARFVARCFDHIHALKRRGVTIVVVTHDLTTAASLCERAVYLEKGKARSIGSAQEVVDLYQADVAESDPHAHIGRWEGGAVYGTGAMRLENIRLERKDGMSDGPLRSGERVALCMEANANEDVEDPTYGIIVRGGDGTTLYEANTLWRGQHTGRLSAGERQAVRFEFIVNLLPGTYVMTVAVSRADGKVQYDWHTDAIGFTVAGPFIALGFVELDAKITVESGGQAAGNAAAGR
jgi:ABC-type polysaccharide/polyol phosphate transport system ATPase subunit